MPKTRPELGKAPEEAEAIAARILTNAHLSAIKKMLEKDHAIDCLLLLYLNRGKWKEAKAYMQELGLTLSDGTFRSRMIEIEHNNLAKSHPIDPLKKYYTITGKGEKLVQLLVNLFKNL